MLNDKKIADITLAALLFYLPISFYITFIYGNLLGFCFSIIGLYYEYLFLRTCHWKHALLSGLSIGLSVLIRHNYSITFIAMILIAAAHILFEKHRKAIGLLFCFVLFYFAGKFGLNLAISQMTGMTPSDGVPMTAYVAMGLQEGERRAPGWYNGYNKEVFTSNHYNTKAASAAAQESIEKSLALFKRDPFSALSFFVQKTASEWNNPSFQCFYIQQQRGSDIRQIPLIKSIIHADTSSPLFIFLNFYSNTIIWGIVLLDLKCEKSSHSRFGICHHIFRWVYFSSFLGSKRRIYHNLFYPADSVCRFWLSPAHRWYDQTVINNKICTIQNRLTAFTYSMVYRFFLVLTGCFSISNTPIIMGSLKFAQDDAAYAQYINKNDTSELENGLYILVPKSKSDYALSLQTLETEDGTPVCLLPAADDSSQNIYLYYNNPYHTLCFQYSQKVLTVQDMKHSKRSSLKQCLGTDSAGQKWKLIRADNGGYYIINNEKYALTCNPC